MRSIRRSVSVILDRLAQLKDECVGLAAALDASADGDLTAVVHSATPAIDNAGSDELGQVAAAVNDIRQATIDSAESYARMTSALRGLIGKVTSAAGSVSASSQQMASTSEEAGSAVTEIASAVGDVARGAERQVRSVESARTLTEQVAAATDEGARTARESAGVAEHARALAVEGGEAVEDVTRAMDAVRAASAEATRSIRQLDSKSAEIGGIVATISGIAQQTNLLALNAAIEAARAGDQGRGFALVAEEVRKLAEESQEAAGIISVLVNEIQSETQAAVQVVEDGARRTEDGSEIVARARDTFDRLGESVEDVGQRTGQIAASIDQIAEVATRMLQDIAEVAAVAEESSASSEEVSASTEQTSASAQEIAASARELARTAESLDALVGRFTLV